MRTSEPDTAEPARDGGGGAAVTLLEASRVETPVGPVDLVVREGRLCAVGFAGERERLVASLGRRLGAISLRATGDPAGLATRLEAYLAGDMRAFDGVGLDLGGTPFQQAVWSALLEIPPGETRSYGQLARRIGRPTAVRAVGAANGSNPAPIVVPCHRVIGADGSLTGYGGGMERKRWLLAHEAASVAAAAGRPPARNVWDA
jgi:methylated-DNA-[protein]-cysteine S-methyltransferase